MENFNNAIVSDLARLFNCYENLNPFDCHYIQNYSYGTAIFIYSTVRLTRQTRILKLLYTNPCAINSQFNTQQWLEFV